MSTPQRSGSLKGLEDIQDEVVTLVIAPGFRIVVKPLSVVYRDPHLRRVPEVKILGAAEVILAPEVLRIVHVRIMVEAIPVLSRIRACPLSAKGLLG